MHRYNTLLDATSSVGALVDIPVAKSLDEIGKGITLQSYPVELGGGSFTNVYDLAFQTDFITPTISKPRRLSTLSAAARGGGLPRHISCNVYWRILLLNR
jgi:hypothetical protein